MVEVGQYLKGEKWGRHDLPVISLMSFFASMGIEDKDRSPYFWTHQLLKSMSVGGKYVISDLRYPVEYAMVRSVGGVVVRVDCPQEICEQRLTNRDGGFLPGIWDTDAEQAWKSFPVYDIVVENAGKDINMYLDFAMGFDSVRESSLYEALYGS